MGKWEISGIVHERVSSETQVLLEYWVFHGQSVDEACCFLEWSA